MLVRKIAAGLSGLLLASMATAQTGVFALGVSAGTLGLGLDGVYGLTDKLNIRANYRSYDFSTDIEGDDDGAGDELEYSGDLELKNLGLSVDYHPFGGGFRLSAGMQNSDNRIGGNAVCTDTVNGCEFGDLTIQSGDGASVDVDMGGTHPYLAIGWGNATSGAKFGVFVDIGVMLQGEPDVAVAARCTGDGVTSPNQAQCDGEASKEEAELEEDVKEFDVFPVLNLGLRWRFN